MHQTDEYKIKTGTVTSTDGTVIGYRQIGDGPGLMVLHDGMKASQHYLRLAEALADSYTVYIRIAGDGD